jgi:hypothetical protein
MGKYHIRLEAIRREHIDRRRLVRALIEAVRASQRQQDAPEHETNAREARDE